MTYPIAAARGKNFGRHLYTLEITIDNSGNASALSQYQVKITLNNTNFDFSQAESNGSDIRILDSNRKVIPYFIRSYDDIGQTAEIWARVDSIPGSGTKKIYLTTGNPTASFRIPPTGKFVRPTTSVMSGLAENMVYDSVTAKYYVVYTPTAQDGVKIASASNPGGPWTDEGYILNLGTAGAWDDATIYAPHLFLDNGTWYLYYSGGPDVSQNSHSIGYATTSSILGTYTRYGSNPVVTYAGAGWEQYRACEPYIYYSNILSKWVMFYMGDSGSGSTQIERVGYATATDPGGPWTKYASNPTILFTTGPAWNDFSVVADPFVLEIGNIAYVFVSAGDNDYAANIGCFKTTDYVTFTEIGTVFGSGPGGRFDSTCAARGGALLVGDTWYWPYTGKDGTNYTWAVATASALSTAKGFDPWQVFDYFDDFNGSSLDADAWMTPTGSSSGTVSVSGGIVTLQVTSGASVHHTIAGYREFGIGYMIEAYTRHSTATSTSTNAGEVGLAEETNRVQFARIYQFDTAFARKNTYNGTSQTLSNMAQALTTGWVKRTIAFVSAALCKFRNDAEAWESISTNIPTRSIKPWIFAFRASANITYEVDWIIVRKYADPEPSLSIA